jgi:hypothetical protein
MCEDGNLLDDLIDIVKKQIAFVVNLTIEVLFGRG